MVMSFARRGGREEVGNIRQALVTMPWLGSGTWEQKEANCLQKTFSLTFNCQAATFVLVRIQLLFLQTIFLLLLFRVFPDAYCILFRHQSTLFACRNNPSSFQVFTPTFYTFVG